MWSKPVKMLYIQYSIQALPCAVLFATQMCMYDLYILWTPEYLLGVHEWYWTRFIDSNTLSSQWWDLADLRHLLAVKKCIHALIHTCENMNTSTRSRVHTPSTYLRQASTYTYIQYLPLTVHHPGQYQTHGQKAYQTFGKDRSLAHNITKYS